MTVFHRMSPVTLIGSVELTIKGMLWHGNIKTTKNYETVACIYD